MVRKGNQRISVFVVASVLSCPTASHVSAQLPVHDNSAEQRSRDIPVQRASKLPPGGDRPINIRVEITEGVFGVFDASPPDADPNAPVPHVAMWLSFDTGEVLFFDSLLYKPYEVGEAIRQLEEAILGQPLLRDWLAVFESTDWLFPARPGDGPARPLGPWRLADAERVSALIGFRIATLPDPMYTPPGNVANIGTKKISICPVTACSFCGGLCCLPCDGHCCGYDCCETSGECCGDLPCCDDGQFCCPDETRCCAHGETCCGEDGCCPPGEECCNGTCCPCCESSGECCEDDGNPCTDDYCAGGVCSHPNNSAPCDDDDLCTTNDYCSRGSCEGDTMDCDDLNPCTNDSCIAGMCDHVSITGSACDDGDPCTENDLCSGGSCGGDPIECDDSNPCTEDSCDAGGCVHEGLTGPACDDEDACTIDDECTQGVCVGRQKDCSDNNPCTTDACDPDTGACTHVDNTAACDDCDPCTSGDQCLNGVCAGTPSVAAASGAACATCPLDVVVDGDGYGAGVVHTCDTQVTIPQGTTCVLVRVYYFSREYPTYTGQPSIYDDQLSFEVSYPSGLVASGEATVNGLDEFFGPGPYAGGNYLVVEELLDYESLTALGDSWLDLSATATNVSDGLLGSGVAFETECQVVDLALDGVPEETEEDPGGFLCTGESQLRRLSLLKVPGLNQGSYTLLVKSAGAGLVQLFRNEDGTDEVLSGFSGPVSELPLDLWMDAEAPSSFVADTLLALQYNNGQGTGFDEDTVTLTALNAEMNPVTSGIDPIPYSPAVVAPMTPLLLDDMTAFWDANTFGLTAIVPDIDLATLPVTWSFQVTSGFINPNAQVVVATDNRSARLEIPFPSFGNLGDGRMEFRVADRVCAQVDTLIKNVQPDLEPGEFRFKVKAHLCHDGQGTSTVRTAAQVRSIMSDVTKVLSQCGIIVTLSNVVTTQVNPGHLDLDSTSLTEMWFLFDTNEDESAMDVFFVNTIDFSVENNCGLTTGLTGTPEMSNAAEAGIAIPDTACDADQSGQEIVRTLAHEITHYLLNHDPANDDHVSDSDNLMDDSASVTKRDLQENQCIEMRSNNEAD